MTSVVFDEESKTGLGFDIGQPQQKCQCMLTLHSSANPTVASTCADEHLIIEHTHISGTSLKNLKLIIDQTEAPQKDLRKRHKSN